MLLQHRQHVNLRQCKLTLEEQFYLQTVNTDYIYDPTWSQSATHQPWKSCFTNIPNYVQLARSNEGGYVLSSPAFRVDAWAVLTSLQTLHMGLTGWMSCNSTLQTNNQTSVFKMSPLRFNSSILAASFCLHRLPVDTWLNSITISTMEMQAGLTPVAFLWRPGAFPRWMEDLC